MNYQITINFTNDNYESEYAKLKNSIKYSFNETTTVKELLHFLAMKTYLKDCLIEDDYYGSFSFIGKLGEQKARLDYPLIKFLNNFEYDLNDVKMYFYLAYGIGGAFNIEEVAKIRVNNGEPSYECPHVHVENPNNYREYVRINLQTFEPMGKETWCDYFDRKRRKIIISILKDNQELFYELYERVNKGEYIQEDYIIIYNDQEYFFKTSRTY